MTPLIVYATRSGGTTLDRDDHGGNPFATALIALAARAELELAALLPALRDATHTGSGGHQLPEWAGRVAPASWRFAAPDSGVGVGVGGVGVGVGGVGDGAVPERRCALVLVVSRYPALPNPRLDGAAHDERRIAAMLAGHGFSVTQGVAPGRAALLHALREFAHASRAHDAALVYSTGHGIESGGVVYLVPGDYPFERGYGAALLRRHAVAVPRIASACGATQMNATFFAGCRSVFDVGVSNDKAPTRT
jgi:Caspase domain